MRGLAGKVALVTGGSGRIGTAVVRRLIEEGARVMIADIDLDAAIAMASQHGENAAAVAIDMADEPSIDGAVSHTITRFGRLDILHNNAAALGPETVSGDKTAIDIAMATWDRVMAVNLRGTLLGCRYAVPHMAKGGGGSIINMTSIAGLSGGATRIAYGTSKGAIATLTQYIASQYGQDGIRCNAIAPGLIVDDALRAFAPDLCRTHLRNNLIPRLGEPDDIASLVAFLASDEASFITGQQIICDGGLSAHQTHMMDLQDLSRT